jgi:acyl-[acyl-carrier-protein]-phospholipid O-acyltransferase / long-chain-fatty-acid--[acyl-carrier-protein] ligase
MALALSWLAPVGLLEKAAGSERKTQLDDLATVVFSSGSTGEPKGVMLSHYNIASNVEQIGQTFDFGPRQRFLGILPFFHSFGFTATLMEPLVSGFGVVYHSNPLEGKAVSDLVRRYRVTILMATPGFLQLYLKTCDPADFGSLTFVMAGAEKLQDWLATEFLKKFRLPAVEGYGCTECSPVISANTRDFRGPGMQQIGGRQGTIGPPLPGISVRLVHPETREPLPVGQPGLLLVRGPNVMQGYLGRPEKTAEVLHDGWYETGDIAALQEDGFLEITDRLSRFSKIAGEMVPHVKVEEKLHQLAGVHEQTFAVAGVPDEKKGERLVGLHKLAEPAISELLARLPQLGLPNLWIPKANQFFAVETLPHLGTGKADLRKLGELARRLSAGPEQRRKEVTRLVEDPGAG